MGSEINHSVLLVQEKLEKTVGRKESLKPFLEKLVSYIFMKPQLWNLNVLFSIESHTNF